MKRKEQYWVSASGFWAANSKINRIKWLISDGGRHLWDYRGASSNASVNTYAEMQKSLKLLKMAVIKSGIHTSVRVSHVQYRYYFSDRSGWGRHRSINDFKPITL